MIHRVTHPDEPDTYVISAYQCWRPGSFASEKAARMGQRLDDADLSALQNEANEEAGGQGGVITEQMICDYRERATP